MPDALRVPCLNGLTLGRLLAITAETDGRPVALLDRGFCPGCPTGGGDAQPASGLVAAAAVLLGELGVPPSRHPRLLARPLPAGRMQADPAGFVLEERVSRRGFLTALTARTAAAVEPLLEAESGPARPAAPLRHRPVPQDRQRLLAALRRLAPGVPLPTHLFPSLEVATTCTDHRICAAGCPTGALNRFGNADDGEGDRGIVFDPESCVACGLCVALCPTGSITWSEAGSKAGRARSAGSTDPAAPRTLTRHRHQTCDRCGAGYAGEDPSCPACRRDQAFAKSAFGALFGGAGRS
jgi:ferredoxin